MSIDTKLPFNAVTLPYLEGLFYSPELTPGKKLEPLTPAQVQQARAAKTLADLPTTTTYQGETVPDKRTLGLRLARAGRSAPGRFSRDSHKHFCKDGAMFCKTPRWLARALRCFSNPARRRSLRNHSNLFRPTFDALETRLCPTVSIDAAGAVFLGMEHQEVNPLLATFTTNASSATASDFSATILWGDGQSSAATISANATGFDVTGVHIYDRQGSYAPVLQIATSLDSTKAVTASYGVLLAADDHARVQTVLDSSLEGSGSISNTVTPGSSAYEIEGSGSYTYTLTLSLIDGLYSAVDATYSGSFGFTLDVSGAMAPSAFTLTDYTVSETGSVDIDTTISTSDLDGSSTRTEDGSITVDDWTKTGDDAGYSLTVSSSTSLTAVEAGVYGGQTYERTEYVSFASAIDEDVDFTSGDYTSTRDDVFDSNSWTEMGAVWTDSYAAVGSFSAEYVAIETGNLGTGDYEVDIDGSTDPGVAEMFYNGVASGGGSAGGDPIVISITKTANWTTGDYEVIQVTTADNGTGTFAFTNQTDSGDEGWTTRCLGLLGSGRFTENAIVRVLPPVATVAVVA